MQAPVLIPKWPHANTKTPVRSNRDIYTHWVKLCATQVSSATSNIYADSTLYRIIQTPVRYSQTPVREYPNACKSLIANPYRRIE
jgi:hypothetical protein